MWWLQAGNFRITLRRGNDGNTLIDECNQECVPGQFLNFKVADTVNADFNYDIDLGQPNGNRYKRGDTWRRDFANGYVEVNPKTHQAVIELTSNNK